MTKLGKFTATRASVPARAPPQAQAGTKLDGNGFQALLRKLGVAGATKAEPHALSPRAARSGDAHARGPNVEFASVQRRPAEASLSDRLLATDLSSEGNKAPPGDVPLDDGQPEAAEAEPAQGIVPTIPGGLSAYVLLPAGAPGERIEVERRAAAANSVAPAARQDLREFPDGDLVAPQVAPADSVISSVEVPSEAGTARPVVVATRPASIATLEADPQVVPVVVTVLARETYFAPVRGLDGPVAIRAPRNADRADAPEPRPTRAAATKTPQPVVKADIVDGDDASRLEAGGVDAEAAQDAAGAAPAADASPAGQSPSGLPAPMLQQIGAAIIAGADALAVPAADRAPALPGGTMPVSLPGRVDAMEIRLDLPEHGALHVRMTLAGGALSLRFRADRDETAHRLRHDRDELSAILTRAGYSTDVLTIQSRPADSAAPSPSMPAGGQQAGAQQAATGDGAAAHGQREQRQFQPPPSGAREQNPDEHAPLRDRSSGGLYV